jgi:tetratricopeptide (TPR) repeat protein
MNWFEWNWTAAEQEFQRAIALNPKLPDAACLYSWLLVPLGRRDEAVRIAGEAKRLDPLSQIGNFAPGSISVFTGQWDRAVAQLRAAIDLDATYWLDQVFLGRAYEQKRDFPKATAAFEQALKLDQDHAEIWSALGYVYGFRAIRRKPAKFSRNCSPPELSATSRLTTSPSFTRDWATRRTPSPGWNVLSTSDLTTYPLTFQPMSGSTTCTPIRASQS